MPRTPKKPPPPKATGRPEDLRELGRRYLDDRDLCLRDLYRIPARDNLSTVVPFTLNYLQQGLSRDIDKALALNKQYNIDNKLRFIVGKHRRGGVSSYILALAHRLANFYENIEVSIAAQAEKTAEKMMQFCAGFLEYWPPEGASWKEEVTRGPSRSEIAWRNGSVLQVGSAGGKSIRGGRSSFILLTEYAWYDDYESATALLQQAQPGAWIFKESTANGTGNAFHRDWKQALSVDAVEALYLRAEGEKGTPDQIAAAEAIQKWNGYYKFFFGWLQDPGLVQATAGAWEDEAILGSLSVEEIRLKDIRPGITVGQYKWRRKQVAEMDAQIGLTPEAYFAQEYPATEEDLFQGSGRTIFDRAAVKRLEDGAKGVEPRAVITLQRDFTPIYAARGGENLWMRLPPEPGTDYAIGADPCNGTPGGDWGVIDVYSRTDGTLLDQVALFRDRFYAHMMADVVCTLAEMYNGAFITPEGGNGPGTAFCQRIFDNGYQRFYRRERIGRSDALTNEANSFTFGLGTFNREIKTLLVDTLNRGIIDSTVRVYHPRSFHELSVFAEKEKTKRLEAPDGDHDDCVLAASLALIGHVRQAGPVVRRQSQQKKKLTSIDEILTDEMAQVTAEWDKRNAREMKRAGRRTL